MSPRKSTRNLSADHKAALAEGRSQGRAIRRYLEALEAHKPKRGRKRTPESIQKRLETLDAEIPEAHPMKRLGLLQEQMDLQGELESLEAKVDMTLLEEGFIEAAGAYSQRKGISYAAWRAVGVPASVLKDAGIPRTRTSR
ncbi:MAG: hypothetical protein JJLCMIEE_00476 [Acidimicrobiales bacterium]|nr:MAG: hypothetical protein EDR02_03970 [Actinomycetota bacterium]MBV6507431.1 hypothetical protein [Acidimicrobiales bacterium]RIK07812.1 MAG: hypothetical protein DCC48_02335 [Acidobacteriota bacterium]